MDGVAGSWTRIPRVATALRRRGRLGNWGPEVNLSCAKGEAWHGDRSAPFLSTDPPLTNTMASTADWEGLGIGAGRQIQISISISTRGGPGQRDGKHERAIAFKLDFAIGHDQQRCRCVWRGVVRQCEQVHTWESGRAARQQAARSTLQALQQATNVNDGEGVLSTVAWTGQRGFASGRRPAPTYAKMDVVALLRATAPAKLSIMAFT